MNQRVTITAVAALAVLLAASSVDAKPRRGRHKAQGQDPNACAHVEGKPVFSDDGFNHVVRVRNTCTAVVKCEVWTNVDEQKTARLKVPAHGEREATLRNGSPISLFRAEGKCRF